MDAHETEEPHVEEPLVDENGVDLTLVRMYLDLTPEQRLKSLVNYVNTIARARRLNGIPDGME